jgi:hypothetical protein
MSAPSALVAPADAYISGAHKSDDSEIHLIAMTAVAVAITATALALADHNDLQAPSPTARPTK